MEISIRQIEYGTPEYEQTITLRDEVLRKPLGLSFTKEYLEQDRDDAHFAALGAGGVLGCLILHPVSPDEMKMRQVAISPHSQGLGIGRKLVEASEVFARAKGASKILLNARETAVKFYLALGYEIVGDPFTEVGLPHRLMKKNL